MRNVITIGFLAVVLTISLGMKRPQLENNTDLLTQETVNMPTQRKAQLSPSSYIKTNPNLKHPIIPPPFFDQGIISEDIKSQNNMQPVSPMDFIHGQLPIPPPPQMETPFSFEVEMPLQTIMSFCPLSTSCQKNTFTPATEFGSHCCLPCDCSHRCYVAGTCCAEMTNGYIDHRHIVSNSPSNVEKESCVSIFITGENYDSDSSYLLFQHCSGDEDEILKRKCFYPDDLKIDELTPVYSLNSSRHYRNVFCAKCNNDADHVLLWQTRLSCKDSEILANGFPHVSSILSILEFISSNPSCALVSDPPLNVNDAYRCYLEEDIVSDCNKPILDSLCKQYYAPVKAGSTIYRNVFCMECASSSNFSGFYDICIPYRVDSPPPFISILSLNIDQHTISKSASTDNDICAFPLTYNDKTDSCIHHNCAVTEIKVDKVCHPIFSKLMNIHLEYRVKLLYRVFTLDMLASLPATLFDRNVMNVLGITLNNLCFTNILDVKVSSGFAEIRAVYIKIAASTNIQHSFKEYEEAIVAHNEKAKENESMALLQIDKSDVEPLLENCVTFVKFIRPSLSYHCINNIAMTKLQVCETINFEKDKIKIHMSGNISIDKLVFVPGEFIFRQTLNGTIKEVRVCLNDYLTKYKIYHTVASAAQKSGKSKSGIFLLICVLNVLNKFIHVK